MSANKIAVIMAGGRGTRLKPYTTFVPKPLMPISDLPIIEVIIKQLKQYGFNEVIICVGHQAQLIQAFLGMGEKWKIKISYSGENEPLGTAGPLGMLKEKLSKYDAILSMNGDVLTTLNYGNALKHHLESRSTATICTNRRQVNIDFGVLETDRDGNLVAYKEKPTIHYDVSMGINFFTPRALQSIPNGFYNIPDLMLQLVKEKQKVSCFNEDCYWLDIGRIEDYSLACEIFDQRRKEFLTDDN
jgi:NDP-sugar pyrophosphorylase family protein